MLSNQFFFQHHRILSACYFSCWTKKKITVAKSMRHAMYHEKLQFTQHRKRMHIKCSQIKSCRTALSGGRLAFFHTYTQYMQACTISLWQTDVATLTSLLFHIPRSHLLCSAFLCFFLFVGFRFYGWEAILSLGCKQLQLTSPRGGKSVQKFNFLHISSRRMLVSTYSEMWYTRFSPLFWCWF